MFFRNELKRSFAALVLLLSLGISVSSFALDPAPIPPKCRAELGGTSGPVLGLSKIAGATSWGETVQMKANETTRKITEITQLVLGQYNVENLLEQKGKFARHPITGKFIYDPIAGDYQKEKPAITKPAEQLKGVADTILRASPDIAVLEEVESLEALEFLNEKYLNGKYITVLIPGNDQRGINVAYLIKGDLPFDLEVQSYKNVARGAEGSQSHLFSRDLPVMLFREKGAARTSPPLMALIGTHFKSQRESPGDPLSVRHRGEQVQASAVIINYYQALWGSDLPIFMAGDYNRDIATGPEFQPLWQLAHMKDSFDIAPANKTVHPKDRVTEAFFPKDGPSHYSQLDSISGSPIVQTQNLIQEASIMPYLDGKGQPKGLPQSYTERETNPSDHWMVRAVVDFSKILSLYRSRPGIVHP